MTHANCIKAYGTKKSNIFTGISELKKQIKGTQKITNSTYPSKLGNCYRYQIVNRKIEYELDKLRRSLQ